MYTTTLGQVQFKLQRYDEAGETLKRAIQDRRRRRRRRGAALPRQVLRHQA